MKALLTMMSMEEKYKYWEIDNDKLEIKDEMLPAWVAAFTGIEALVMAYYTHEKELVKKADKNAEQSGEETGIPIEEQGEDSEAEG